MLRSPRASLMTAALLIGAALTGCGQQTFDVVKSQSQFDAGSVSVPPKVDILLALDDSGSTYGAGMATAGQNFLTQISAQNWDYRFSVVSLTNGGALPAVTASKYDFNWNTLGQWKEPYPGAPRSSSITSMFTPYFSNYPTPHSGGGEPGLRNIGNTLHLGTTQSQFLRADALSIVLVISNGQDDSDGFDYTYYPPTAPNLNSSSSVITKIRSSKANPQSIRLYAAVHMAGSNGYNGSRYVQAAGLLNGKSYNLGSATIDQNRVSAMLNLIAADLQAERLNFVTSYLVLPQRPKAGTIQVYKTVNGIERKLNEGTEWTFNYSQSTPSTVYTITAPVPMNQQTGYPITLLGSARLVGNDTGRVEYTPYGVTPSP